MAGAIRFVDLEPETNGRDARRFGWLLEGGVVPPVVPDDYGWFRHAQERGQAPVESPPEFPPPHGEPIPWIPIPSPFSQNLLGNRIIPRVPMRYKVQPDMAKLGQQKALSDLKQQTKIDPRSVRFTETVQSVVNSLLSSGSIYSTGPDEYFILFTPRQVEAADAFNGEIFYDPTLSKLGFKDPIGFVSEIQLNPW